MIVFQLSMAVFRAIHLDSKHVIYSNKEHWFYEEKSYTFVLALLNSIWFITYGNLMSYEVKSYLKELSVISVALY